MDEESITATLARGETRAATVFALLRSAGWQEDRVSGSHHIFTRDGRSCIPVAVHGGKLRQDVVRHVLRHAGLTGTGVGEADERVPGSARGERL